MKYIGHPMKILVTCLAFSLLFPRQAFAYLDPGTGSYFLQVILATALGALFTLRIFWKRIISYLKTVFSRAENNDKTINQ